MVEVRLHLFLTSALDGFGWSALCSERLFPRDSTQCPLDRLKSQFEHSGQEKTLSPAGNRRLTLHWPYS